MEPTLPMPQSPDKLPVSPPVTTEGFSSVEVVPAAAPERVGELPPAAATVSMPSTPAITQPQVQMSQAPAGAQGGVQDSPMIADDVDVMEKEWVDKAKRIVSETKDNPHQQEKEVSKLQADYLMKRYNKKIKLAE